LMTTDYGSMSISRLSGDGTGDFLGARRLLTGAQPYAVVAGDLNVDSILDLAVTDSGSGELQIFLGAGKGKFVDLPKIPAGRSLRGLVVGDFDINGRPDLAAADSRNGKAVLLMNTCSSSKVTALLEGEWEGPDIHLLVSGSGAVVEYNCAHGTVDQIVLDEEGRFDAQGTYESESGAPARNITAVDETGNARSNATITNNMPTRYTGRVTKDGMSLTVSLINDGLKIGEFSLKRGSTSRLHKCM